ncbi:GNAT family N-acetyltransferase [Labrys neptuniae]
MAMLIREATSADAPAIAGLMDELGYHAGPALIIEKLDTLARSGSDAVFLACDAEHVFGCLSAHIMELFHAPGRAGRITALVVDAKARGRGAGRALIERACGYFRERGCLFIEVTSGDHRPDAHAFYRAVGFAEDKRRFVMKLRPAE